MSGVGVGVASIPAGCGSVLVIEAVDAHAGGEPGRVIVGGVEDVPGATMFDKMTWLQATATTSGCGCCASRAATRPRTATSSCRHPIPEADAGYVIMEQVEYPGMSGTNTICVVTVLLETGMLPMTEPTTELTLEAPAGLIRVTAECADGKVDRRHVPQRAGIRDPPGRADRGPARSGRSPSTSRTAGCSTSSPTPSAFGLRLTPDEGADIVRITEMIKAAAAEQLPVVHPEQPGFAGITIGQLSGPAHDPAEQPCGTS